MKIPAKINFDFDTGAVLAKGIAHIPKIYQGAPYTQEIGVKNATTGEYRDFSVYSDIVMQLRYSQGKEIVLSASVADGTIAVTLQGFRFAIPASLTAAMVIPPVNLRPGLINEVPFVFDIELIQGGAVVERFAQGTGFLVVNTTR